jgi:hypothetical protein
VPGGLGAALRAALLWLIYVLLRTAGGALAGVLLRPEVQLAAREAGVAIGALLIFGLTWLGWERLRLHSARAALATGIFWAALTLAFDLTANRGLGSDWRDLLRDYDPRHGGMVLGLLALALTPWLVWRLKGAAVARGAVRR